MLKRTLSLLLAALTAVSVFTACAEKADSHDAPADVSTAADGETEAETELTSGLEPADFDGYTFHIFRHDQVYDDFIAEELNGETLNDAQYSRMKAVEDSCNIKIERLTVAADMRAGHTPLGMTVQAGSNDYDLASISAYSICNALTAGYLVDLTQIEALDLSREWWDQYAVEDCTFVDSVYMVTGDISTVANRQTFCIYFNKKLAENYNMPDVYSMVNDMTWTIDNFQTFAELINEDTDNDGNHDNDKDDAYGIYIWDDIMMGIVNASGINCCEINAEGELELTLYSEKFVDVFDKFTSYAYNKNTTCAYQRNGYAADYGVEAFTSDRALFFLSNLTHANTLRQMESDFGILPLPLYDEFQERYYSSASSWGLALFGIPKNAWDDAGFERAGYITQLLGFESKKALTPAYYEMTLKGKTSRDEESAVILDLLFATRCYDFGWYFEIGGYNEGIMNLLRAYNTDVASMYKKSEKRAIKTLDTYNEAIAEMRAGG